MNQHALSEQALLNGDQHDDSLAVASQCDEFVVITKASRLQRWEATSGLYACREMATEIEHVTSVHYSSDGTALLLVRRDGSVALYDRASQRIWDSYDGHRAPVVKALWRTNDCLVSRWRESGCFKCATTRVLEYTVTR